jgi:hypothetical protein
MQAEILAETLARMEETLATQRVAATMAEAGMVRMILSVLKGLTSAMRARPKDTAAKVTMVASITGASTVVGVIEVPVELGRLLMMHEIVGKRKLGIVNLYTKSL